MRLWWNGIHNGLKIRRGNLAGSNPANRTKEMATRMGGHFFGLCNRKGFDERPQNAAVWRFAARGFAGRCGRAARSASGRHRWAPAKKSRQSHHVVASSAWLATTFLLHKQVIASLYFAATPFRKRFRSVRLFGCKRPHNGSLSLPIVCGYDASHDALIARSADHKRKTPMGAAKKRQSYMQSKITLLL